MTTTTQINCAMTDEQRHDRAFKHALAAMIKMPKSINRPSKLRSRMISRMQYHARRANAMEAKVERMMHEMLPEWT